MSDDGKTVCVIPSRYGSTRFPGKPLADVAGRSLVQRVYEIGRAARGVDEVIVATDDARIAEHVEGFGGRVAMTDPACRNGTERVHAAVQAMEVEPARVINLQGDAALTPPWVLEAVVEEMKLTPSCRSSRPRRASTRVPSRSCVRPRPPARSEGPRSSST